MIWKDVIYTLHFRRLAPSVSFREVQALVKPLEHSKEHNLLHVHSLLSCFPDVHHQHHQDQVQPPGQACALSGHALFGLPHRPQPGLRVPKPLLGRGGWIYTGIGYRSVSGEDSGKFREVWEWGLEMIILRWPLVATYFRIITVIYGFILKLTQTSN